MLHIVTLLALLIAPAYGLGQHETNLLNCSQRGIAVSGYDLVSYHQPGGPAQGVGAYSTEREGMTYLFVSQQNLKLFQQSPEQYLPVYQGYCAASLAMGRLACPDYTNFKLENGRLLLFEVTGFTNGKTLWNSDPNDFRKRADTHFSELVP